MSESLYKSYRLETQNANLLLGESKIIFVYGPSAWAYSGFVMLNIIPIVILVRAIYFGDYNSVMFSLILMFLFSVLIAQSERLTLNGQTGIMDREKYLWRRVLIRRVSRNFSKNDVRVKMHKEQTQVDDDDHYVTSMMLLMLNDGEIAQVTTKKAANALVKFLVIWKEETNYTVVEDEPVNTLRLDS